MTRHLFSMLANFLLYGPLGLHREATSDSDSESDTSKGCSIWNIDILSVEIIGSGTMFTNPYDPANGQYYEVPSDVVENTKKEMSGNLNKLCSSGALTGRVRVVRLIVDGTTEDEWVIDQQMSFSKSNWAHYGWVIEWDSR